jgi:hypothetical protein
MIISRNKYPSKTQLISTSTNLPISTSDVGEWLNISSDAVTARSSMLTSLINMSVDIFEKYTWYDILFKTYNLYYDIQYNTVGTTKFIVNIAPIKDYTYIDKVYYLDASNTWIEIDKSDIDLNGISTNIDIRKELNGYMSVYIKKTFELSSEINTFKLKIVAKSGYDVSGSPTPNDVIPEMIKIALRKIVAFHYTNRGDCGISKPNTQYAIASDYPVPQDAIGILNQYRIALTTFNDILPEDTL